MRTLAPAVGLRSNWHRESPTPLVYMYHGEVSRSEWEFGLGHHSAGAYRKMYFGVIMCHHELTPNQSAAANRRPAGQLDGSGNLAATVAADRAFPAAVAELGR